MTRLRFLVAVLALLFSGAAAAQSAQVPVVMYATSWCPYCAKARAYFKKNRIDYVEHDIEKSAAAQAEHRRLGGRGVPLIVVGKEKMSGYSEQGLDAMFARAGVRQ